MSTVQSIVDQLKKLILQANLTTGKNDSDTTLAIESLIAGYGNGEGGGGYQPPSPPATSGEFLIPVILGEVHGQVLEIELINSSVNVNNVFV